MASTIFLSGCELKSSFSDGLIKYEGQSLLGIGLGWVSIFPQRPIRIYKTRAIKTNLEATERRSFLYVFSSGK